MLLGEGAAKEEGLPPSAERSPPPVPTPPLVRPSSADSLSSSGRRAGVGMGTGHDEDGAPAASDHRRLKTRVLSEWLTLARSGSAGEEGLSPPSDSGAGSCSPQKSPPTPEEKVEELEIFVRPRKMPEATTTTTVRHSSYLEKTESMVEGGEAEEVSGEGFVEVRRRQFDADKYRISKQGDIAIEIPTNSVDGGGPTGGGGAVGRRQGKRPVSMPPAITGGEIFRQQMYMEYMHKVAERAERKQQKVIKLTAWGGQDGGSSSGSHAEPCSVTEERFVNEFMGKVRQRMDRMGMKEEDEEGNGEGEGEADPNGDSKEERTPSFTIEGGLTELPKHLRDDTDLLLADDGSLAIAPTFKATANRPPGVWSPSKSVEDLRSQSSSEQTGHRERKSEPPKDIENKEDVIPVWVPKSAGPSPTLERKEFRPVSFDANSIKNKKGEESGSRNLASPKPEDSYAWSSKSTVESTTTSSSTERRSFIQSPTSPSSGSSIPPFSSRLPRAQNPTITLLQKAREGQLPRGAHYLDEKEKMISKDNETELMYMKKEFETEDEKRKRKIVELGPKKFDGIGPTTKEGIPIILRSGIKEENQGKWYRKMYDSLHRTGKDDEYVTVRYKTRRGQYPYTSAEGYLSEPDPIGYDSDMGYSAKYATLDRRRIKNKDYNFSTCTMPRSKYVPPPNKYATDVYKNQPGRIEDYEPGHSSIAEKEAKLWWDEVLDIFDGWLDNHSQEPYRFLLDWIQERHANQTQPPVKPYMAHALKESGYESDSTLLFKRREENIQSLSPMEQKQAYKTIQMGGEVPLHGLRKPAPERPKESPHKYVESEVTIHYRSPIRAQAKEALPEEELARRQEEAMRRIYQEERRRKYLQELQDMESRRHTDNFTPSQKSPIPLNRYDNFLDEVPSKIKGRDHTPEPKVVARALYNFVGQTSRELSFRKGDIIFVRRQIDKNWYEGEHNAMIGLFPFNYVEIIPYDGIRTMPKRPTEGQARAKYNFVAQTHLELSLIKGELVVLTRRVDNNWFEGRIGNRKGIFPISYVEVLVEPGDRPVTPSNKSVTSKLAASPVSSSLNLNGSNVLSTTNYNQPYSQQYLGKQQRQYQVPNSYTNQKPSYVSSLGRNPYSSKTRSTSAPKLQLPSVNQTLHIDTHSDPVPYRALYNYKPQNEDELELQEGDTVYVMEKCDDGWYVGSSHRTGYFGTFPGNYVERI